MLDKTKPSMARIPSVDLILQQPAIQSCVEKFGHSAVKNSIRFVLADLRQELQSENKQSNQIDTAVVTEGVTDKVILRLNEANASSIKPVFNLTGTVIHTNLGRAPLAPEVVNDITIAMNACNLEFDLTTGKRGDRDKLLERRLCELTGAEAATLVNNNAAALVLVLNTLAKNKKVPVSRGELVEIGGSFRIPDIIETAGCKIKEIGTTNRTHLKDYKKAIDDKTALLLKVHTSNYSVEGFTKSINENELSKLAKKHKLPLVSDLGSGSLVNLSAYGLPKEPQVSEMISAGVDVVTFSGDKLLGGPQAGLIVGKKVYIEKIKNNPLKRALRVDKLILAALEATLKLYSNPDRLSKTLPTLRLLSRSVPAIEKSASEIFSPLETLLNQQAEIKLVDTFSQIGSGALPSKVLPSKAIAIKAIGKKGKRDAMLLQIATAFRALAKPVIGRINDGVLYFDCRCLENTEDFIKQLDEFDLK